MHKKTILMILTLLLAMYSCQITTEPAFNNLQLVTIREFDAASNVLEYESYIYDTKDRLKRIDLHRSDGTSRGYIINEYDSSSRIISATSFYSNEEIAGHLNYNYNNNNLVQLTEHFADGSLLRDEVYRYDSNGNLTRLYISIWNNLLIGEEVVDSNNVPYYYDYQYDNNNNLIGANLYRWGDRIVIYTYQYDSDNNLRVRYSHDPSNDNGEVTGYRIYEYEFAGTRNFLIRRRYLY